MIGTPGGIAFSLSGKKVRLWKDLHGLDTERYSGKMKFQSGTKCFLKSGIRCFTGN